MVLRLGWVRRWLELSALKHEAKVARAKARITLAPYEVKAEIEWSMKFLQPLDKSWRGDVFAAVWAIPVVALMVPTTHGWAMQFFQELKDFHPYAPVVYLSGWAAMVTATYGLRSVNSFMSGGVSGVMSALSSAPDDVPASVVNALASNANAKPDDPG